MEWQKSASRDSRSNCRTSCMGCLTWITLLCALTVGVVHCARRSLEETNNGQKSSSRSTTTATTSSPAAILAADRTWTADQVQTTLLNKAFTKEQKTNSDWNGRPPEEKKSLPSRDHMLLNMLAEVISVSEDSTWELKSVESGDRYRRRGLKSVAFARQLDDEDIAGVQLDHAEQLLDEEEGAAGEEEGDEDDGGDGEDLDAVDDDDTSAVEIRPIFDKRAFCQPRRHPVNVPQPEDPTLIYQPMCIQVERCGGCCAHELFECVPSVIKNATRKVVALRYPHSGAEYFVFEAVAKVQIERHTKCKCQCKMQPEDCSANQIYDRQNCQCVCEQQNGHLKCKAPQVWSDKECRCRCPEFSECSTGTYFDTRMCRCRAAGEILAQSKLFKSQLRRLYH